MKKKGENLCSHLKTLVLLFCTYSLILNKYIFPFRLAFKCEIQDLKFGQESLNLSFLAWSEFCGNCHYHKS